MPPLKRIRLQQKIKTLNAEAESINDPASGGWEKIVLNPDIQRGKTANYSTVAGGVVSVSITFARPFKKRPVVLVALRTSTSAYTELRVQVRNITTTDFIIDFVAEEGGLTVGAEWLAYES